MKNKGEIDKQKEKEKGRMIEDKEQETKEE